MNVNVNLSFTQRAEAVKQLSPKERLLLNDVLWDERMEMPFEHKALVTGRIENAKQNPDRLLDWREASKTLQP